MQLIIVITDVEIPTKMTQRVQSKLHVSSITTTSSTTSTTTTLITITLTTGVLTKLFNRLVKHDFPLEMYEYTA